MGRVLGVDTGTVRIGLALSDPDRLVATPLQTVPAGDDIADRLAAIAVRHDCDAVVVGLPRGMNGRDTASTRAARMVAKDLRTVLDSTGVTDVTVGLWDERLSSVEAERALIAAGRRRERRQVERDIVAATIILQGWLDAQR